MPDEDDIFGSDDDLDPSDDDVTPEPEPAPAATGTPPAAAAEPAGAPAAAQPDIAAEALDAVKREWVAAAEAAGHRAADFDSIGIRGLTQGSRDDFMREAEASHNANVKALEAKGFRYDPDGSAAAAATAAQDAADAQAKSDWGPSGGPANATEHEMADAAIQESVKAGDTQSVIRQLLPGIFAKR